MQRRIGPASRWIVVPTVLITVLAGAMAIGGTVRAAGSQAPGSAVSLFLPLVLLQTEFTPPTSTPSPTSTPQPGAFVPQPGSWASPDVAFAPRFYFQVSPDSTQVLNFKQVRYDISGCTSWSIQISAPYNISDHHFHGSSPQGYSFDGEFTSATAATGTYGFSNYALVTCDYNFLYLNKTGTWTASPYTP